MSEQPPIIPQSAGMVILNWIRRNIKFILLIVFVVVLIYIGSALSSILTPVLIALLIAYILNPIVNFFEKRNVNRTVVISFLILTFYWVVTVCAIVFIDTVGRQLKQFTDALWSEDYKDVTGEGIITTNYFYVDKNDDYKFN